MPPDAIKSAFDQIDLCGIVADWCSTWLGYGAIGAAETWQEEDVPEEGTTIVSGDGLAGLWLGPDLRMTLQSRIFGSPPYGNLLTDADTDLLEKAIDTCLQDLCTRLSVALVLDRGTPWHRGKPAGLYRISAVGKDLSLIVSTGLAIDRLKASIAAQKPPPLQARLDEALSRGEVRVGAWIGACQLTLAELKSLMPGDVLTLDRAITSNVQITIDGERTSLPCQLVAEQDGLTLVLQ